MSSFVIWQNQAGTISARWNKCGLYTVDIYDGRHVETKTYNSEEAALRAAKRYNKLKGHAMKQQKDLTIKTASTLLPKIGNFKIASMSGGYAALKQAGETIGAWLTVRQCLELAWAAHVARIAAQFGITAEKVRENFAINAAQMRDMEKKARHAGRKINGYTAEEHASKAAEYEALARGEIPGL